MVIWPGCSFGLFAQKSYEATLPSQGGLSDGRPLMSGPPLSAATDERITRLFPPSERELVRSLLIAECGNDLPGLQDEDSTAMDRFRFAVLKLSEGNLSKFDKALCLAKTDWRDLLMAAGFGESLTAHESWQPDQGHR